MKITKKWRRMAEIYKRFIPDSLEVDLSEQAALDMFLHENGQPLPQRKILNGFAIGKKWMSVTIDLWKQDIKDKLLFVFELLEDDYPEWFLKSIGIIDGETECRLTS